MMNRQTMIGGSDVPIIMGLSPFKKRDVLLLEKKGLKEPFAGNVHTRFGNDIEESLSLFYELEFETKITCKQEELKGVCDGFDLRGHIDGKDGNIIVDFKATSLTKEKDWAEGVPHYYYHQALFYMYLSGEKKFYFYVGFVDKTKEEWIITRRQRYELEFDQKECDKMLCEISKFIEDIRSDLPTSNSVSIVEQEKMRDYLVQLKEIKSFERCIKERLLKEMEEGGVTKLENNFLCISYIPAGKRKGAIDEDKLRESGINPDNFRKPEIDVKSGVRINIRGQ